MGYSVEIMVRIVRREEKRKANIRPRRGDSTGGDCVGKTPCQRKNGGKGKTRLWSVSLREEVSSLRFAVIVALLKKEDVNFARREDNTRPGRK